MPDAPRLLGTRRAELRPDMVARGSDINETSAATADFATVGRRLPGIKRWPAWPLGGSAAQRFSGRVDPVKKRSEVGSVRLCNRETWESAGDTDRSALLCVACARRVLYVHALQMHVATYPLDALRV